MGLAFRLFFYQSTILEPNLEDPFVDKSQVPNPPLSVDITEPPVAVDIPEPSVAVDIPNPPVAVDVAEPEDEEAPKHGNQILLL